MSELTETPSNTLEPYESEDRARMAADEMNKAIHSFSKWKATGNAQASDYLPHIGASSVLVELVAREEALGDFQKLQPKLVQIAASYRGELSTHDIMHGPLNDQAGLDQGKFGIAVGAGEVSLFSFFTFSEYAKR